MAGRKTKLTKELIAEAEKLLRAGNYACVVAEHLGIGETTWYAWIERGEKEKRGLFREFRESIKRAESTAEIGAVAGVLTAGRDGNWQALAWFLERKYPSRYGRRIVQEISGPGGGPLEFEEKSPDLSILSDEELEDYAALCAKVRGDTPSVE